MLGRKPKGDARSIVGASSSKPRAAGAAAKKRKWQENSDDSSGGEAVTKEDLEAFRRTVAKEEEQERKEREKKEREEAERLRIQQEKEEAERKRKEEDEAASRKESDEARRVAEELEEERRKHEASTDFVQAGALPMDVTPGHPAGVRAGKEHLYKTSYCKRWEQGNCQFGAACHFAHGERELRGKPPKGSPPGTLSTYMELQRPAQTQGPPRMQEWGQGMGAPGGPSGLQASDQACPSGRHLLSCHLRSTCSAASGRWVAAKDLRTCSRPRPPCA